MAYEYQPCRYNFLAYVACLRCKILLRGQHFVIKCSTGLAQMCPGAVRPAISNQQKGTMDFFPLMPDDIAKFGLL